MRFTAKVPHTGSRRRLRIPPENVQLRLATLNHKPVNRVIRNDATDLASKFLNVHYRTPSDWFARLPRPSRSLRQECAANYSPLSARRLLYHPDRHQPPVHQRGPVCNRKARVPQSERVLAVRVQMHLRRNPRLRQRDVIRQRVVRTVFVVILCLQQECRWCPWADMNLRIQPQILIRH